MTTGNKIGLKEESYVKLVTQIKWVEKNFYLLHEEKARRRTTWQKSESVIHVMKKYVKAWKIRQI